MNKLALLILTGPLTCLAVRVPGIADAHLSTAAPTTNYGALAQLTIGGGSTGLINFDLATLPSGLNGNAISKATLILYINRVGQAGRLDVAPILGPWTESLVTLASQPALGTVIATSNVLSQGNLFVQIDITGQMKTWINSPQTAFGLALSSNNVTPGQFFVDSKESVSTSHPASIEVSFVDSSGLPGPKGERGDAGPFGPKGPTGPQGVTGLDGPPGALGLQGLQGPAGVPGNKGKKGELGHAGPDGKQGLPGPPGDKGRKGQTGDPGLFGKQGAPGQTGSAGPQGPQGAQGAQGIAGPKGPPGLIWYYWTDDAGGNSTYWASGSCPVGYVAISGACGHRDANSASKDILLNYWGPDFGNIRTWRCWFENTKGSSRAVRSGVLCTTASAGVASADGKSMATEASEGSAAAGADYKVIKDPSGAVYERWSAPRKPALIE